jgi:molybdopterin-guanine dinucleotide biosynthesis protein A
VTDVQLNLPWNSDRVSALLDYIDRWLVEAWKRRSLFAGLLVGGKSKRMGWPKQTLLFGSRTLGEIAARALGDAISADNCEHSTHDPKVLPGNLFMLGGGAVSAALDKQRRLLDPPDLAGPLAALITAHRWAPTAAWIVSACDHPWIKAQDLTELIQERSPGRWAIVSRQRDGHPSPTVALYEPQALYLLERSLVERGIESTRLAQLFDHSHTWIRPEGSFGSENINTPLEYSSALREQLQNQEKQ